MVHTRTITRTGNRKGKRGEAGKPFLFLVLQCERPKTPGARFCLAGADEVTIGRAPELTAERTDRALRIGLPDERMSSRHVRLQLVLGTWVAEDLGSKNGTLLDGRRVTREQLADQALLELGHTFLLFREALRGPSEPVILDGCAYPKVDPSVGTPETSSFCLVVLPRGRCARPTTGTHQRAGADDGPGRQQA